MELRGRQPSIQATRSPGVSCCCARPAARRSRERFSPLTACSVSHLRAGRRSGKRTAPAGSCAHHLEVAVRAQGTAGAADVRSRWQRPDVRGEAAGGEHLGGDRKPVHLPLAVISRTDRRVNSCVGGARWLQRHSTTSGALLVGGLACFLGRHGGPRRSRFRSGGLPRGRTMDLCSLAVPRWSGARSGPRRLLWKAGSWGPDHADSDTAEPAGHGAQVAPTPNTCSPTRGPYFGTPATLAAIAALAAGGSTMADAVDPDGPIEVCGRASGTWQSLAGWSTRTRTPTSWT